jgi:hypothetical protein
MQRSLHFVLELKIKFFWSSLITDYYTGSDIGPYTVGVLQNNFLNCMFGFRKIVTLNTVESADKFSQGGHLWRIWRLSEDSNSTMPLIVPVLFL